MTEIEKAQRQYEQARARLQSANARARSAERKRDARRKIILGGLVLSEARRDPAMAGCVRQWIAGLPEKDRTPFQGWDLTAGKDGHEPSAD